MKTFRVWIRPLGDFCRFRVDGIDNAQWLLGQLSQSFVFRTFEPMGEMDGSTQCTFQVPCHGPMSPAVLQKLLRAIPEVQLMRELA